MRNKGKGLASLLPILPAKELGCEFFILASWPLITLSSFCGAHLRPHPPTSEQTLRMGRGSLIRRCCRHPPLNVGLDSKIKGPASLGTQRKGQGGAGHSQLAISTGSWQCRQLESLISCRTGLSLPPSQPQGDWGNGEGEELRNSSLNWHVSPGRGTIIAPRSAWGWIFAQA